MEQIETLFQTIVRLAIHLIELVGMLIIVISMARGFIDFLKKRDCTRIELAQGIMLGLEFKVGSEVLRSVIVTGWNELGTLAAIILLRSLLTLLLHWEIGVEEKRQTDKLRLQAELGPEAAAFAGCSTKTGLACGTQPKA
jgi:uncharacterized membrane protein